MAKKKNSSKVANEKMEVIEVPVIETTIEKADDVVIEEKPEIKVTVEEEKEELVEVVIEPKADDMLRIREILGNDDDIIINEALVEKIKEYKDKQVMPIRRAFGYTWNGQEFDW